MLFKVWGTAVSLFADAGNQQIEIETDTAWNICFFCQQVWISYGRNLWQIGGITAVS